MVTALLLCFAAAGSATATSFGEWTAYEVLLMWRFILGIGIGGEYPLSMAVTAEKAASGHSAENMAATYMMFQVGQLLAPSVVLCLLYSGASAQLTWRFSLAVGSILAMIGTVLRAGTMTESEAWLEARRMSKSSSVFCSATTLKAVGYPLLGTTTTYFVYDVVSWGVGSYTSSIFSSESKTTTIWYMLLVNLMATPGFLITPWMSKFGRKNYQLAGFLGMAACFAAVGAWFETLPQGVLVGIFGFQKIFDSAGPGATTFIIPGEIFPTAIRATCHGASSAAGKLGAFVGMYSFPVVQRYVGDQGVLLIGSVLLLVGFSLTWFLTPPYTEETLTRLQEETRHDFASTTAVLWADVSSDGESFSSSSE